MKLKIFSSFFFFKIGLGLSCFGQEAIRTTHLGFSVTPQLNTAIFKNKEEVDWQNTLGLAAAGNIHLDLGAKTQFITGLEFQYIKYYYQDYSGTWPNEIDSNGVIHPDKNYFDYQYSLLFIGLPVQIKLKLNAAEKPNHLFLSAGFTLRYRFATGGDVSLVEDGTTTINRDIDSYFWTPDKLWWLGTIGIGYEMKWGNHKLSIAPSFEYSPGQLYNDQGSSAIADAHAAFLGICFSYY